MKRFQTAAPALALLLGAGVFAAGCGDSDSDPFTTSIRAIHLSPAPTPAVDVFLAGSPFAAVEDLAFPDSTGFLTLFAGTYDVDVAPAGAGIGAAVLSATLDLDPGEATTVVAYDTLASLDALVLKDDFSPVPAGLTRLRAIHAAAGVGTVDIYELSGAPTKLYDNVPFGGVGDYAELDLSDPSVIGLDTNNALPAEATFDVPALPAGEVLNVFAVADAGGPFLLAQFSDGSAARIDAN